MYVPIFRGLDACGGRKLRTDTHTHTRDNYSNPRCAYACRGLTRARAKTGGPKGIRGDRRFKGRGGYPMETSYHFIHQNTKNIRWFSIFREVLHEVATLLLANTRKGTRTTTLDFMEQLNLLPISYVSTATVLGVFGLEQTSERIFSVM